MERQTIQPPKQQQKLSFAQDDRWENLVENARIECLTRIVQLLQAAIMHERLEGSINYE